MFVTLRSITLPPRDDGDARIAALRAAAAGVPGATSGWIAATTAGATINAGGIAWRMGFTSEAAAIAAPYSRHWAERIAPLLAGARIEDVGYRITRGGGAAAGRGIWRALVFRVMPHAPPGQVRALEEGLALLPAHVGEIRRWALSRVAYHGGAKAFTHVWEQEFDDIGGLTGPYMDDPLHWGLVDAFFDAECPDYIVDPQLIQIVGPIATSIMAPTP